LPHVIKIDHYNFELCRFKVGAFFSETQCTTEKCALYCYYYDCKVSVQLMSVTVKSNCSLTAEFTLA